VDLVEVDLVEVDPAFVLRLRAELRDRARRLGRSVISGKPPKPSRRMNAKVTNASPVSTTRPATNFIISRTCLRLQAPLSGSACVHGESVPDDRLAGRLQSAWEAVVVWVILPVLTRVVGEWLYR
jgi:hypothetical protein